MTVKGIDVSSYQSSTYSTSGAAFVFVKATEGTTYTNPRMAAQAKRARDAGCVVGFYHFLRPGSMAAQAAYFVEQAASIEGDPLWADWEDPAVSCADKDAFLAEVARLRGATHRVGLYCNTDFWLNRDTTATAGDALWIAQYNGKPGKPSIQAAWRFHQYTDSPVDTSVGAFKDAAELRAWARKGADDDGQEHEAEPTPTTPSKEKPAVAKPKTYTEVWETDAAPAPSSSPTAKTNPTWKPLSLLAGIYDLARETRDLTREVRDLLKKEG